MNRYREAGRITAKILPAMIICMWIAVFFLFPMEADAQCPMCRMSAENNLKSGGTAGKGLNSGIFYLLAMPYVIVGTLGLIWWRNNRSRQEEENPAASNDESGR